MILLLFITYISACTYPVDNLLGYPPDDPKYYIDFNTTINQANFVVYTSNKDESCSKKYIKNDPYGIDPIRNSDYTNTGYDRGHLVPKADYGCDTNYIPNVTPMLPSFNQGVWKSSESYIRNNYYGFTIIKGCRYSGKYIETGHKLYIPDGCYYAVLDNNNLIDHGYISQTGEKTNELIPFLKCDQKTIGFVEINITRLSDTDFIISDNCKCDGICSKPVNVTCSFKIPKVKLLMFEYPYGLRGAGNSQTAAFLTTSWFPIDYWWNQNIIFPQFTKYKLYNDHFELTFEQRFSANKYYKMLYNMII